MNQKKRHVFFTLIAGLFFTGCLLSPSDFFPFDCDTENSTDADADTDTDTDLDWVTTWVSSQQLVEDRNKPQNDLSNKILRQVGRLTLGGKKFRFEFSNENGDDALTINAAGVAKALGDGQIDPVTHADITFNGRPSVTIPQGKRVTSDEVEVTFENDIDISVTLHLGSVPFDLTGHPGARMSTFISESDDDIDAASIHAIETLERWYFWSQIDTYTDADAHAIVVFGDSITDGLGSEPNKSNRWVNVFAQRLLANETTKHVAVLNHGVGGNAVVSGGLGVPLSQRFERDLLGPLKVKQVLIMEGVNDLGAGTSAQSIQDVLSTCIQIAHQNDIEIIGGTIMPFGHYTGYYNSESAAQRIALNEWIRNTADFDDIVDFDEIARNPNDPEYMAQEFKGEWDGLHPCPDGHRLIGEAIDLSLF